MCVTQSPFGLVPDVRVLTKMEKGQQSDAGGWVAAEVPKVAKANSTRASFIETDRKSASVKIHRDSRTAFREKGDWLSGSDLFDYRRFLLGA